MLRDYFGAYLFEQFCRVFFERLVQKKGEPKALAFLSDIKEFIKATLVNRVGRRVITKSRGPARKARGFAPMSCKPLWKCS